MTLQIQLEQARLRWEYFARECQKFEEKYQINSEIFLQMFERGELGDDVAYFEWYSAKKGFDLWEKRYHALMKMIE